MADQLLAAAAAQRDKPVKLWNLNGTQYTSARAAFDAANRFQSSANTKPYWQVVDFELAMMGSKPEDDPVQELIMKCGFCKLPYKYSNLSQWAKVHLNSDYTDCKGKKRAAAAPAAPAGASGTPEPGSSKRSKPSSSSSSKAPGPIQRTFVAAAQAQKAIDELSLFFFTNPTVSLHLIGDAHLKNAFAALGVSLPGRTALGGTLLDKQHALAVERVLQNGFGGVLDAVEAGQFDNIIDMYGLGKLPVLAKAFALASDGWRRKLCAQGTPLINLMIIPDEGPAVFIKVVTAAGVIKDADWIAGLHKAAVLKLSGGVPSRCRGLHMDGTAANRKAMAALEEEFKHMVNLTCQAHCLNLLIKDLGNVGKRVTTVGEVLQTCKELVGIIIDNEKIRGLVQFYQVEGKGKTSAFPSHVPTRFAVLVEQAEAVLDNKDPIRKACDDDRWEDIAAGSVNGDRFWQLAFGHGSKTMWKRLEQCLDLLKPVAAAIHQVEADQPMLSQVLQVWRDLLRHFLAWHSKVTDVQLKADNVPVVLRERKAKSMPPAAFAASVLDPLNFAKQASSSSDGSSKWKAPISMLSVDEQKVAKKVLKRISGAGEEEALLDQWSAFKLASFTRENGKADDLNYITSKEVKDRKTIIKDTATRLAWWETCGADWPLLAAAARRLLPRHATSCSTERNWSQWGLTYTPLRNRLGVEKAEKMIFIAGNKIAGQKKAEVQVTVVNEREQQEQQAAGQHGEVINMA